MLEPLVQATGMKEREGTERYGQRNAAEREDGACRCSWGWVKWKQYFANLSNAQIPELLKLGLLQCNFLFSLLTPHPALPATLSCADRPRLQLPARPRMGPDCAGRRSGVPVSFPGTAGALTLIIKRSSSHCTWVARVKILIHGARLRWSSLRCPSQPSWHSRCVYTA